MFNPKSDYYIYNELYFAYDKPVPYKLRNGHELQIYPVKLQDSLIFLTSCDLLTIDKNSLGSVEIIQMSYLKYIMQYKLSQEDEDAAKYERQKLTNICILCFHMQLPFILNDDSGKPFIGDVGNSEVKIYEKDFEDIRRIVMYQNILDYDDEYIDPDLKKAIEETKAMRAAKCAPISTERKIAIVAAHTGYDKEKLYTMTYRSFNLLFNEVCEEVDFLTTRPIALYAGKAKDMEHWIYKKKKDKYSDYIMTLEDYNKSMGGDGQVADGKIRASKNMPTDGAALDAMYNMNTNSK